VSDGSAAGDRLAAPAPRYASTLHQYLINGFLAQETSASRVAARHLYELSATEASQVL
jgi:hypothetical protein